MDRDPIFIGITRSFWFTGIGFLVMLFSADPAVLNGLGEVIGLLPWFEPAAASAFLVRIAPFVLWVLALRERSGPSRPYTLNPKALK